MARGRPSKLTPDVVQRLVKAIEAGNYYEAACAYAGISYGTFRRWMVDGENATRGKYRDFYEAITRAEQTAEVRMVAQWQQHMPMDYRAIRDFLERRFPQRWGKKLGVDMNQEVQGQVVHTHEKQKIVAEIVNTPELAELIAERYRQRTGDSSSGE